MYSGHKRNLTVSPSIQQQKDICKRYVNDSEASISEKRGGTILGAAPLLLFLCGFFHLPSLYFTFHLLCLPRCKLFLPLLTLIEGQNIRQNTASYRLDLILWYSGVID